MATRSPSEKDKDVGILQQFNDLKKKHLDAVLLFRQGDFYETFKQDAVKAAAVLAIAIADRIFPTKKEPINPNRSLEISYPIFLMTAIRDMVLYMVDS